MEYFYKFFLRNTTLSKEEVSQELLSLFPSPEITETVLLGNLSISVKVKLGEKDGIPLTEEQKAFFHALKQYAEYTEDTYFPVYTEDEIREKREQREREEEEEEQQILPRWKEQMRTEYPQARYYLCKFSQKHAHFSLSDYGPIEVVYIYPETFSLDKYEQAKKNAHEREEGEYKRNRMNCQIVARFAESREKAREGIFLDS